MNIYEGIVIATFVMCAIIMITQYIDSEIPTVADVLQIMNIFPCYEIKAYKDRKRLSYYELIGYINRHVKDYQLKNGILYIEI